MRSSLAFRQPGRRPTGSLQDQRWRSSCELLCEGLRQKERAVCKRVQGSVNSHVAQSMKATPQKQRATRGGSSSLPDICALGRRRCTSALVTGSSPLPNLQPVFASVLCIVLGLHDGDMTKNKHSSVHIAFKRSLGSTRQFAQRLAVLAAHALVGLGLLLLLLFGRLLGGHGLARQAVLGGGGVVDQRGQHHGGLLHVVR